MCLSGDMDEKYSSFFPIFHLLLFLHSPTPLSQNVLGEAGKGFLIAMKAFDRTRPPVSYCMGLMVEHGE